MKANDSKKVLPRKFEFEAFVSKNFMSSSTSKAEVE